MSYTLYGDLGSGAFSAEAALAETGAAYNFERVSLGAGEQSAPAFLAINPSGKVPALRLPEGDIVTESAAILLTLADYFPQARLLPPAGGAERAMAYRWLAFMASEIYPMVELIEHTDRFAAKGTAADALREAARALMRERILLIERAAAGPFMLAGGFSLLDIYAAMFTRWSIGRQWREANIPRLITLAQTVSQRPAIAPVWARHFKEG